MLGNINEMQLIFLRNMWENKKNDDNHLGFASDHNEAALSCTPSLQQSRFAIS